MTTAALRLDSHVTPQLVGGISCRFSDVTRQRAIWRQDIGSLYQKILYDIADTHHQIENQKLLRASRDRLKSYAKAQEENLELLRKLLDDFASGSSFVREVMGQQFAKGIGHEDLAFNYLNIFRDWAWTGSENEQSFQMVQAVLPPDKKFRNVLVIGAGAGRLSQDLYLHLKPDQLISADINPLLCKVAHKMFQGEMIELHEFPYLPRDAQRPFRKWNLKARQATPEIQTVLCDFFEDGWTHEKFDLVVTPWFLDVHEQPVAKVLRQIQNLMAPKGTWLNFGPLMFKARQRAFLHSPEEVQMIMDKIGLTRQKYSTSVLPYLRSELESSERSETVHCWSAENTELKNFDFELNLDEVLPDFLMDPTVPVKFEYALGPIVSSHTLVAEIFICAEKGMSLNQMVEKFADKSQRDRAELEVFLRQTLLHLVRSSRTNPYL